MSEISKPQKNTLQEQTCATAEAQTETQKSAPAARREFLKFAGLTLFASAAAAQVLRSTANAQGAAKPAAPKAAPPKTTPAATPGAATGQPEPKLDMVKPTDPQAQALGYVEDATKVDTKKWSKRAGPEGAKQFCYNCQFYQNKKDPKNSKAAPCQIFAGKGVTSKGWCNSWVQDPTIKG